MRKCDRFWTRRIDVRRCAKERACRRTIQRNLCPRNFVHTRWDLFRFGAASTLISTIHSRRVHLSSVFPCRATLLSPSHLLSHPPPPVNRSFNMSSNSDIQPILTAAREAAGLGAGRSSSSSEEEDCGSGPHGRAPGARPETASAEHQRPTPAVDYVADVGASSENACSICGYRRRFGDDGHSFGSCEANVREYTASQNVPGPLRSQICTCSAAKAKGCTLNAQ